MAGDEGGQGGSSPPWGKKLRAPMVGNGTWWACGGFTRRGAWWVRAWDAPGLERPTMVAQGPCGARLCRAWVRPWAAHLRGSAGRPGASAHDGPWAEVLGHSKFCTFLFLRSGRHGASEHENDAIPRGAPTVHPAISAPPTPSRSRPGRVTCTTPRAPAQEDVRRRRPSEGSGQRQHCVIDARWATARTSWTVMGPAACTSRSWWLHRCPRGARDGFGSA